jgi:transcriptional regulator with GAF, ATPase, and Fis domain
MPVAAKKRMSSINTMREASEIDEHAIYPSNDGSTRAALLGIVGRSLALQRVLRLVESVAKTDATVLIRGETEPVRR